MSPLCASRVQNDLAPTAPMPLLSRCLVFVCALAMPGCATEAERVLTLSGSAVGREADVLRLQLERFQRAHPSIRVAVRATPDAADQRHQLYVQWLNARATEPDILQLDVVWTPEFAAAGWIASLDRFQPPLDDFFPAAVSASRWRGSIYALPWFIDAGMLYWRTDLVPRAPRDLDEMSQMAARAVEDGRVPFGLVWQGARYEGLVTVFLEYLGAFGGRVLDERGGVALESEAARRALATMIDAVYRDRISPPSVLTWQEEQTRFAFQNGQAAFMRNWPYAYALLQEPSSSVAGRFAVAPMPAGPGGRSTATLGGSVLAVNAHSDQPEDAYAFIEYLLQPEQMVERARIAGEYPPRPSLYRTPELAAAVTVPLADMLAIIERATPRPVTPVYSELSQILQVSLHRALTRQQSPDQALHEAAAAMRALLARTKLGPPT
jgi:ABC-type glycerol-3-phosphate transport system substrate-binding protein